MKGTTDKIYEREEMRDSVYDDRLNHCQNHTVHDDTKINIKPDLARIYETEGEKMWDCVNGEILYRPRSLRVHEGFRY